MGRQSLVNEIKAEKGLRGIKAFSFYVLIGRFMAEDREARQ
jgi:hypothetical protein